MRCVGMEYSIYFIQMCIAMVESFRYLDRRVPPWSIEIFFIKMTKFAIRRRILRGPRGLLGISDRRDLEVMSVTKAKIWWTHAD